MNELKDMEKYWNDFLYVITGGNASDMMMLKRFDIFDFFNYADNKMKKHG